MSSSDGSPRIPRSGDGGPHWAADTDPVGPVTPELALVDPVLTQNGGQKEVRMSTMQFGEGTPLGTTAPVPVTGEGLVTAPPPLIVAEPLSAPAPSAEIASAPQPAPPPGMPVPDMRDVPLGTLVFRAGLVAEEQLEEALQDGMKTGRRLGEILLERGWVSETDLGRLLAAQKGLAFVELDVGTVDPTAPPLLPEQKARLHGALPIGFEGGVPVVAVADPSNDLVIENIRRALNCEPHLVVVGRDELHRAISHVYGAEPPAAAPAQVVAPAPLPVPPPVEPAPAAFAAVLAPSEPVVELGATSPEPAGAQAPELTGLTFPELTPAIAPEPAAAPAQLAPAQQPLMVSPAALTPSVTPENGEGPWVASLPAAQPVPPPGVPAEAPVEVVATPAPALAPIEVPTPPVVGNQSLPHVEISLPSPEPAAGAARPVEASWFVVLRLTDGDRIEVGAFEGDAAARAHAQTIVQQLAADPQWPFVGDRFVRPDAIVSVDLVENDGSGRWLGSSIRAAALGGSAAVS